MRKVCVDAAANDTKGALAQLTVAGVRIALVNLQQSQKTAQRIEPSSPLSWLVSADYRSLAALRVCLGILLAVDLVSRLPLVGTLYSNDGVLTNHFALFRPLAPFQFSLYFGFSSTRDVTATFMLTLVVYLLFAVGYRTRLFHILSLVAVTSLHSRNLMAELPSDAALHLLVAWSLLLPLGERFSVDSFRRSFETRREKSPAQLNERWIRPESVTSLAAFGLIAQLAVMHIVAAFRQSGVTWKDGTAFYYALHHHQWATDFGAGLARRMSMATLAQLPLAYRIAEFAIGALILVPNVYVRRTALVLLVAFHAASRSLFNPGIYDLVLLGMFPLLLSAADWRSIARAYVRRLPARVVCFDADCGICFMICRWLARWDGLGRLKFVANSAPGLPVEVTKVANETVVVIDERTGAISTRSGAVAAIFASLPLGGVLSVAFRLPGIAQLADAVYDRVAQNRAAISVWLGFAACGLPRPPADPSAPPRTPWQGPARAAVALRELGAAGLLALCTVGVSAALQPDERTPELPEPVFAMLSYPRIFQRWGLFAPDAPKVEGTIVVDAWTGRGTRIDPLTGGLPHTATVLTKDPPRRVPPAVAAYFESISGPKRLGYADGLRDHIMHVGDEREPGDRLSAFTVSWVEAPLPPPEGGTSSAVAADPVVRRITAHP